MKVGKINTLEKTQIKTLFSQAYIANIAVLATGILTYIFFIYANLTDYINLFLTILIITILIRILLTFYANKLDDKYLKLFVHSYVIASLLLAIDFSFLSLTYYDLKDFNLRYFIALVHIGLITSAIITMSTWMIAYIVFVTPQLIALITIFILNNSIIVALITAVFSGFIIVVAKKFNAKFNEGQILIFENEKLISNMEQEIKNRKQAHNELINHKEKLEEVVASRTSELQSINDDLLKQIELRNEIEKKLEFLAYYDELTNLPNRTLFIENLKKAVSQAKRQNTLLGVLFVDLDRFKNINDSHGHSVGDKLLKKVSERLTDVLRDSDTIARNGGDEFIIYLENMKDAREPYVVANKVINLMNEKFHIDGHDIHIGASVGISLFPLDGQGALDLIKAADTAMFEAKKIGRNNFQFYSSSMSNQITDRLNMENALRDALEHNEFFLVFQPQVDIRTHRTIGFEALLRWNNPQIGFISPAHFVPVLEETGLIYSVGDWIIQEALKFIKSGKSKNTKVSINLSALQCSISNYSTLIKKFINDSGVDPSLIEFEITETLLIDDFSQTEMFLTDISKLGCTIALDDFGTGYTSFSYLTKLPIDIIKIDRSLVAGIDQRDDLQNIVKAIVTMSHSLGIENVFEGVETDKELNKVAELNGSIIQGYLFSKPLSVAEIDDWFNSKTPDYLVHSVK